MPQRDIVVIGGSAGAIAPLKDIVGSLPASFPASILIVTHLSPDYNGNLDELLSRISSLPVSMAVDAEPIRQGRIYLARPDNHLSVGPGRIRVVKGPRENRHRPAVDALFRTAARVYGSRVIGIVLSGLLDDGSAGLYAVKQRGGIAIVQDPAEARFPEMPRHALFYATPHYVLRAQDIAANLINLVQIDQDEIVMPAKQSGNPKSTSKKAARREPGGRPDENLNVAYFDEGVGTPSVFACPECHGVLWELKDGHLVQFRCRVGHTYGMNSLAKEMSDGTEAALWAAMRALEEKAAMQRRLADTLAGDPKAGLRFRDQAAADDANARLVRDMIFRRDAALEAARRDEPKEERKKKSA